MNCPHCETGLSTVLATRVYQEVCLRRTRECFNGHRYSTYEVTAGCLDRRGVTKAQAGKERRARASKLRAAVRRDDRPAAVVAREQGVSAERVRQLRRAGPAAATGGSGRARSGLATN